MTITELYDQLCDKEFQNHYTGNLFFPAYMYMYDATKEYEVDREILSIRDRLFRPANYLDALVIDIFDEFLTYLKSETFGKKSKYDFYLDHEASSMQKVADALKQDAYNDRFLAYLDKKIQDHLSNADEYEVAYVFVKGFGNSFPYLRASRFMNKFEKYINGFKLIMFYPGQAKDYYSLFGLLKDENLYRAIKLLNE